MTRKEMLIRITNKLGKDHPLTIDFTVLATDDLVSEVIVTSTYKFILEIF